MTCESSKHVRFRVAGHSLAASDVKWKKSLHSSHIHNLSHQFLLCMSHVNGDKR